MDKPQQPGLFGSARAAIAGLVEIGHTRLQLAATELEEERLRIGALFVYASIALFFLGVGLVLGALLVMVLFWDSHRVLVLALETALFLGVGAGVTLAWRRKAAAKPKLLETTLAELQRDRAALQPWQSETP